jgi:hypothetical protein
MYNTINAVLENECRCSDNEIYENGSFNNENIKNRTGTQDGSVPNNSVNHYYKFELIYKRWEALYV